MSAITTATIVGLSTAAARAGASVYAAKKGANAAKNAAATQSAAADKALAAQKEGYQQQRQDFSPYQQAGTAALGRLGATAGTYTGGMPSQGPPPMPPPSPPQGIPGPVMNQQGGGLASLGQSQGQPPGGPPPGAPSPTSGIPPSPGGGVPGGGQMVRVQAPTGEVAMLPMAQAQAAVQKGAKILQGPPQGGMPQPGMA
jgi:hypothetical protein